MKPISLKMTAFASYSGTAEVDFTRLYESGIFVITGKTGGGKTTILDAICTALYGEATGKLRGDDWRQLRSIGAPDSRDTEIEFIFSTGGVKYRFYRRWHMPNSKKDDRRLNDAENACYRQTAGSETWEPIATSNAKAVEKAAVSILGLTHDQFVKLIMLPQGEFRELLTADDKVKIDIFSRLFDTQRWQTVIEKAKKEAARLEKMCDEQKRLRDFALSSAGCSSPDELRDSITRTGGELQELDRLAGENRKITEAAADALQKGRELDAFFIDLQKAEGECRRLDAESARYRQLKDSLARSRQLRGALSEYRMMNAAKKADDDAQTALAQAEADKRAAENAFAAAKEQAAALPALEDKRKTLTANKANLDDLAGSRAAHVQATADLRKHSGELKAEQEKRDELKREKEAIEGSIEKGRDYLRQVTEATEALPAVMQRYGALEKELKLASELEDKTAKLSSVKTDVAAKDAAVRRKEDELTAQRHAADLMERAIREDRAYSLAAELAEGMPCPVCGSVHHPSPAKPAASTPTAQQLKTARELAEATEKALNELNKQLSVLENNRQTYESDIEKIRATAAGAPLRSAADIQTELEAAGKEKQRLEKLAENAEKARNKVADYEKKKSTKETDLQNADTHINNLSNQIAADNATLTSLDRRLQAHGIRSFDELDRQLGETGRQLQMAEDEIRRLTNAYNEAESKVQTTAALLRRAEEMLLAAREDSAARRTEFTEKCARLGIPEGSDFDGGILPEATEAEYENSLSEYRKQRDIAGNRVRELSEKTDGRTRPDLDSLEKAHRDAQEKGRLISEQRGQKNTLLESLEGFRSTVEQADSKLEKLEKKYGTAKEMSLLLFNRNESKMSIDRYVIGVKMDEIILQANQYLRRLTRGQYAMRRIESGTNKTNHSLDIEILDGSTGGVRSVSTLSGGEMFLASLSLAFGLSETVQSFAGGIHLDSLFIDEGFGSLDSETLDTAMEAITRVRENRLLGIISHVSELQERIPCGIEVVKNRDGSSLKMRGC